MDHPNIAHVLDGGETATGRPYFVMELVRGIPITDFCDENHLPLRARLELFISVCQAVQHAHHRGIIHRDLKPSNIMVGSFGEVLVLDWGIARLTRDPETDRRDAPPADSDVGTLGEGADPTDTAPGTVLGTPGYMAPEQAQGWHHLVDARTDVYALGAILRALVRPEEDSGRVPPPLVSIWSRAMAAEPDRRYESAAALAADVARYLDGEPVQAHRESAVERAGRLFRKYQTAIILVLTYLLIRFVFLAARGL